MKNWLNGSNNPSSVPRCRHRPTPNPNRSPQVEGSLGALRQGLQKHEEGLSKLSRDVSDRAQVASQEMTDFKDKVQCTGARLIEKMYRHSSS